MADWVAYDKFMEGLFDASTKINFDTGGDTLKIALVTSSYTVDVAAHDFFNDVSTYEVTGTNYTAGGATLANQLVTLASHVVTFDADDITWAQSASGFSTARTAILYKSTGTDSTSPLIAYCTFTADKGNVDGPFVLAIADVFDLIKA